ncbi:MAG: prepilin peptidase [Alphaproteobacteria bacterium]|nr:prepilin peptidase [Alphaproteobacteria bacterium]
MLFVFCAFVFGFCVPYMARRFNKFMPATFAGALVELCRREKKVKAIRKNKLYKKFMWRSFMCGVVNALIVGCGIYFTTSISQAFLTLYICLLFLMAEIDFRSMLLPDILTIPLLLIGLFVACFGLSNMQMEDSVVGAMVGYFLPVLVCLLIVWYKKDAFGGGDIKLLSALGAWLGVESLLNVIALASILGIVYAIVKRKSSLAFGPMIAIAGIVMAILRF